jgi:hypothetical protein
MLYNTVQVYGHNDTTCSNIGFQRGQCQHTDIVHLLCELWYVILRMSNIAEQEPCASIYELFSGV